MKIRVAMMAIAVVALTGCDSLFGPDGWVQEWSVDRKQSGIYQTQGTFNGSMKTVRFDGVFAIPHENYKLEQQVNVGPDTVTVVIRAVESTVPTDSVPGAFGFKLVLGEFDSGSTYTFHGTLETVDGDPFVRTADISFIY